MSQPLFQSSISSLPLVGRGKVRDIYAVDDQRLLIVTSDRLSAFDVVLPDPIPGKGVVLTAMACFWFERLAHVIPNQLTGIAPEDVVTAGEREQVAGRALVVKRLRPLPIEAVVRGYLIGSGWKDYRETGTVCGVALPPERNIVQIPPEYEGVELLTEDFVRRAHGDGLVLWIWPNDRSIENRAGYAGLLEMGVDGINAADPAEAVAVLQGQA